jgi:predicted amidohydrolase YtcJ
VVLSADFLSVPESAVPSIRPLATMVGGRFVYAASPDELGLGR